MKHKPPIQAEFNFDPDLVDSIVFEGDGEGDLVEGFFDSDEVVFSHTAVIEIDRTKCVYCGGRKDGWSMGHRANCCETCCRTVPFPEDEDVATKKAARVDTCFIPGTSV